MHRTAARHPVATSETERQLIDSLTATMLERDTYRTLAALIATLWLVTVVLFAVHGA